MNTNVLRVVKACTAADVPVLLWGGPGIGKTTAIEQMAAEEGAPCEVVIGSIHEPSDFVGLPVVRPEGGVAMEAPQWALNLAAAGKGYLVLDELSNSAPAVQAGLLRVALNKVVGNVTLPQGVKVIAAANEAANAADFYELSPPLANRFCHLHVKADPAEWTVGITMGFHSVSEAMSVDPHTPDREVASLAHIAAFITTQPDLLYVEPTDAAQSGGAWPSPRTWHMLGRVLSHLGDDDNAGRLLAAKGLVGEAAAMTFLAWSEHADLPDAESVLENPAIFDFGKRADRSFAVLSAVVGVVANKPTEARWSKAWKVLAACATQAQPDVAAAAARRLQLCRPDNAKLPPEVKAFVPVLQAAGMVA
ncbi:MAG TPA: AAA family ATPase [Acidimicrobiales bacterium]|nr:AAA family ATPase [Acidimicrobiales bacterium]